MTSPPFECRYLHHVDFLEWATTNTLGATIVGGLVVLAVWSLIGWLAKSRKTPARWLGRFAKWAWSWRPVSDRRLRSTVDMLRRDAANLGIEAARQYAKQQEDQHERQLELDRSAELLAQLRAALQQTSGSVDIGVATRPSIPLRTTSATTPVHFRTGIGLEFKGSLTTSCTPSRPRPRHSLTK